MSIISFMDTIIYRPAEVGDESQISGCMWASGNLWELTDGTPESVAEWIQLCDSNELKNRISSRERTLVATWNGLVVGFIAFKRSNHLSLLFVRREFSRQGIARQLFTRSTKNLGEITVNAAETVIDFYKKIGFIQNGDRFLMYGIWAIPMKWISNSNN